MQLEIKIKDSETTATTSITKVEIDKAQVFDSSKTTKRDPHSFFLLNVKHQTKRRTTINNLSCMKEGPTASTAST